MTTKFKKMTAMLLVGVLACTALVGCDEEEDATTTDSAETTKPEEEQWDSSAYTGLTPAGVYAAMDNAVGYEIVFELYDGDETPDHSSKAIVDEDVIYVDENDKNPNEEYDGYADWGNKIAYLYEDGKWKKENFSEEVEMLPVKDIALRIIHWIGVDFEQLFTDSNYTVDQNKYTMHSEFLDQWNETHDGRVHSVVMERNGTKYSFSVRYSLVDSFFSTEFTIEFKPTSVTIPDSVRN